MEDLNKKTISGIFWKFGERITAQLITFIVSISFFILSQLISFSSDVKIVFGFIPVIVTLFFPESPLALLWLSDSLCCVLDSPPLLLFFSDVPSLLPLLSPEEPPVFSCPKVISSDVIV